MGHLGDDKMSHWNNEQDQALFLAASPLLINSLKRKNEEHFRLMSPHRLP